MNFWNFDIWQIFRDLNFELESWRGGHEFTNILLGLWSVQLHCGKYQNNENDLQKTSKIDVGVVFSSFLFGGVLCLNDIKRVWSNLKGKENHENSSHVLSQKRT